MAINGLSLDINRLTLTLTFTTTTRLQHTVCNMGTLLPSQATAVRSAASPVELQGMQITHQLGLFGGRTMHA